MPLNDSMQGVSTLSFALMNSAMELTERNTTEAQVQDGVQFVSRDADIYLPLAREMRIGDPDLPKFAKGSSIPNPIGFSRFRSDFLDRNITTIEYNNSIFVPTLLKDLAADPNIYGVLIQKGEYIINPLHPMIAIMITSGDIELPEEANLHIFEWSNSKRAEIARIVENGTDSDFYISEYERFFGLLPDILKDPVTIKQTATLSDETITSLIEDPFIEDIRAQVRVNTSESSESDRSRIKSMIIPTQMAVDGIATPYYGSIFIKKPTTGDIKGHSLSPMVSGNIQQSFSSERRYSSFHESGSSQNVCTGSQSSTGPKGWFTLSRINLSSMYYEKIVDRDNVMQYVCASKKLAAGMWAATEAAKLKEIEDVA